MGGEFKLSRAKSGPSHTMAFVNNTMNLHLQNVIRSFSSPSSKENPVKFALRFKEVLFSLRIRIN